MYSGNFIKKQSDLPARALQWQAGAIPYFDICSFQPIILLMMIIFNTTFLVLARPPHSAWQEGGLVRVGDCVDYNTV
jgi:hypothetical protein